MALSLVAVASIADGASMVASDAAVGPPVVVAYRGAPAARHVPPSSRPRRATTAAPAPIVIPPAPSTTTSLPPVVIPPAAPAPVAPDPAGATGGALRRVVVQAAAPAARLRAHAAVAPLPTVPPPATVTDPSQIATAVVRTVPLYASPGAAAPTSTLANPNYLHAVVVLLVIGYQPGWVEAYVPVRPNETAAWIPAADVALSFVPEHVVVHLRAKTLTLYQDNTAVATYPVAPGAPDSPTPTGLFFIAFAVRVTDPSGPYGPDAFGTSDFSGTYMTFEGGPGQIGIHGTDQPWVIGTDASHGCIRLYNADIAALARQLVPGAPVQIEA